MLRLQDLEPAIASASEVHLSRSEYYSIGGFEEFEGLVCFLASSSVVPFSFGLLIFSFSGNYHLIRSLRPVRQNLRRRYQSLCFQGRHGFLQRCQQAVYPGTDGLCCWANWLLQVIWIADSATGCRQTN